MIFQQQRRVAAAKTGNQFQKRIAVCRLVLQGDVDFAGRAQGVGAKRADDRMVFDGLVSHDGFQHAPSMLRAIESY